MSTYQSRYNINDNKVEAGIDEAGRGPFWGPLMAAAVILPDEEKWTAEQRKCFEQVRDSKKIAEKKRQRIAEEIKRHVVWGLGTVSAEEIDDNGMTWSNQTAFARAVEQLSVKPDRLIVDGTMPLNNKFWTGEQHIVTDGDATYLSIAAASILAKVEHDAWIVKYCTDHPELNERYNLLKCKGYGTAAHTAGIREHGLDKHHRRLFLRKLLGAQSSYKPAVLINDDEALQENVNNCMIIDE